MIFDVDGTLVDSVDLHARAWQEAFRRFGIEADLAEIRQQIGKGGDRLIPVFVPKERAEALEEPLEKARKEIFAEKYMAQVKPLPCVRELFQRLREDGKKIALASSAKGDELQTYKCIAGIEDLLDEETSSEDASESKPAPDIVVAAMKKLDGASPERTVMIGDSPYDAEAAGKAGLRTIGVLSGGFGEQRLRNAGCVEIYRDTAALLRHYEDSILSKDPGR